jgi:hypothetical protein
MIRTGKPEYFRKLKKMVYRMQHFDQRLVFPGVWISHPVKKRTGTVSKAGSDLLN